MLITVVYCIYLGTSGGGGGGHLGDHVRTILMVQEQLNEVTQSTPTTNLYICTPTTNLYIWVV